MAKIGWGEFVIILVIALLVLGPDKLPQAGRALGKAVRSVKKFIREATEELELDELKEIKSDVEGIQKELRTMGESLAKSVAKDAEKMEEDLKAAAEDVNAAIEKEPEPPAEDKPEPPAEPIIQEDNAS